MLSVMQEKYPPRAPLHEKRHQRGVGLCRIAVPTCQHQVVWTIVGRLAPAGPDVIEGDGGFRGVGATIGTDRTVLSEKPIAVRLH